MSQHTILCLGDVVGITGRFILGKYLASLKSEYNVDFVIANGENIANGIGLTRDTANELLNLGVNVLTTGNHVWNNKDVFAIITNETRILRPYNYPLHTPGLGYYVYDAVGCRIGVINLMGRTFMDSIDCPFQRVVSAIKSVKERTDIIIIDFHAEATAEKLSLFYYLDGQVSAIFGTHTHVQTADNRVSPSGTAYITDIGMCGSFNSVIGMKKEAAIARFTTRMPHRFEVETSMPMINGVVIEVDSDTGRALNIKRINKVYENEIIERQDK